MQVKVRQQVQTAVQISSDGDVVRARARGVLGTLASVVRLEGPSKLYCGLVPGLQRQMVSTVQHSTVQYSTVLVVTGVLCSAYRAVRAGEEHLHGAAGGGAGAGLGHARSQVTGDTAGEAAG